MRRSRLYRVAEKASSSFYFSFIKAIEIAAAAEFCYFSRFRKDY
jgi:hypothetical protein